MDQLHTSLSGRQDWLRRYLLVCIGMIFFWGCGTDSSPESDHAEAGGAAFTLKWHQNKHSEYYAETERTIKSISNCTTEGVATIECAVYAGEDILLVEGEQWACADRGGVLDGIAAGGNRTVVCLGRDDKGEVVYLGQEGGVTIKEEENETVEIDCHPFFTTIEYPTSGLELEANNFEMTWDNVNNASQYQIEIADNLQFHTNPEENDGINTFTTETNFYPSTLLAGTTYYWRITPLDKYGNSGRPSDHGQFITQQGQDCFRPVLIRIGNQIVTEGLELRFGVSIDEEDIQGGEGNLTFMEPQGLPAGTQYDYIRNNNFQSTFRWTPPITGSARTLTVNFQVCNTCVDQGPYCADEDVTIAVMPADGGGDQCQTVELEEIGDRNEEAGETLSFPISGSGADQLAYSAALIFQNGAAVPAGTPLPAGAEFDGNPLNPAFSWTPGDDQVGVYVVRFTVTNAVAGCSDISVYEDVAITVTASNGGGDQCQEVQMEGIGDQEVIVGGTLDIPIAASGADQLAYSAALMSQNGAAVPLPAGAEFDDNPLNPTFSWTPGDDQVGVYVIRFMVTNAVADCSDISVFEDVTISVEPEQL